MHRVRSNASAAVSPNRRLGLLAAVVCFLPLAVCGTTYCDTAFADGPLQDESVLSSRGAVPMKEGSGQTEATVDVPRQPLKRPSARDALTSPPPLTRLFPQVGRTGIVFAILAGLLLVWRLLATKEKNLPTDLVEVYGKVPLNPKQHLHLVRVGQRLLVLIESSQGLQRLAEISEPEEVRRIVGRFKSGGSKAVPTGLDQVVAENRNLSSFRAA